HGAVSEQTAREMARGALENSHAQVTAAITGIAGPDGGTPDKPVGTVCFAWADATGRITSATLHFTGDREAVRRQSVDHCLNTMLRMR
ncbi:MAG TPA: nicotinamide-nucleotide amidohydrolase family protein, partial [Methylophilaceae bacterium]|nr:nicotinamide-nucleotide amidohydrolase family protein [Methylophilaceae bacterium]